MNNVKAFFLMLLSIWFVGTTEISYGRNAAMLIDAANGNILYAQQANQAWYPASLTKVMTLYIAFDALRSGKISLYDEMVTSSHASIQPNSKLGLRRGEYITVETAILAVITRSANDAAVVLAEHLGGTEENFAVKMTNKAHAMGMHHTHFMNATGLPHNWQVTTARDMALMAWRIQRNFPEYYPFFSAHSMYFRGTELRAINKFTANYPGAEGMKTGFTCGSGYNLIGAANQNGTRLIGVVLGGMTSGERYDLMMDMMDMGFDNPDIDGLRGSINSIPTNAAGSPPYQLQCGNRHDSNVDLHEAHETEATSSRHRYKRANLSRFTSRVAMSKPVRLRASINSRPIKIVRSNKVGKHVNLKIASLKMKSMGKSIAKPTRSYTRVPKSSIKFKSVKQKTVAQTKFKTKTKVEKPALKLALLSVTKTKAAPKTLARASKKPVKTKR